MADAPPSATSCTRPTRGVRDGAGADPGRDAVVTDDWRASGPECRRKIFHADNEVTKALSGQMVDQIDEPILHAADMQGVQYVHDEGRSCGGRHGAWGWNCVHGIGRSR